VIVPRSAATTPPDAVTPPLAVTGGHAPAHAPEHTDLSLLSFTHRYTARPDPSVRNDPAEPERTVITVLDPALAAAGLAAAVAPAWVLLLLPPLAHAAASSAVPTGTATLTIGESDFSIVVSPSFVISVVSDYGDKRERDSSGPRVTWIT
jgi:hypothetical protein